MRAQSSHSHSSRGLDAYFSPPEAVWSLLRVEDKYIPSSIWEPAAGDGAIVLPMRQAKYKVFASDIADYGLVGCNSGVDYLNAGLPGKVGGIVTNPPYRLAMKFAEKAINEVPYVALLLRTNFLESTGRMSFFKKNRPARIWISSRRLPMMHRLGWTGPRTSSNICFAWFVWDKRSRKKCHLDWFDWKDNIYK